MSQRILIVEDEPDMRETCRRILARQGYQVSTAADGPSAMELVRNEAFSLVITDLRLPEMSGMEILREVKRASPSTGVVLITAYGSIEMALQAVRDGAFDYIPKPFSMEQLRIAVERALEYQRLEEENKRLRQELHDQFQFGSIVGASPALAPALQIIRKTAGTEATILIHGESGTGKELLARCIHANSLRRAGPFVPIDCAALPDTLLESELFGFEKGAFTGAEARKTGLLEQASGGTLFLDEVANIPLATQAKLLRVLEERQFRRLGGQELTALDVRLVTATHRNLAQMVAEGAFREDLYYRLHVIEVCLPPLRERPADIVPLAHFFLQGCPECDRKDVRGISSAAQMVLQNYRWPGNVRELKNVICRAVSLTESNQITPLDLPPEILEAVGSSRRPAGRFREAKRQVVDQFERSCLEQLLAETAGNVSRAARQAGMKRSALHRLLRKHHLRPARFRGDQWRPG